MSDDTSVDDAFIDGTSVDITSDVLLVNMLLLKMLLLMMMSILPPSKARGGRSFIFHFGRKFSASHKHSPLLGKKPRRFILGETISLADSSLHANPASTHIFPYSGAVDELE